MDPSQISINFQLETVTQLAAECEHCRVQLQTVQDRVRELVLVRDEELDRLQRSGLNDLQAELQRIQASADHDLDTLQLDGQARLGAIREHCEQGLRSLNEHLHDEVADLEERRSSELWMLQSVMDEEVDDSPMTQFDREADAFVTQKSILDEKSAQLQQQLQQAGEFLASCRSAADATLPTPTVSVTKRSELRETAIQAGDLALAEAAGLEGLHLPQWVRGFRLWGLSFLAFFVLWISVILVRADLRQFINPEFSKPDWQWAVVAALISVSIVMLGSFAVLVTVQNKLRNRFQAVLQHICNAEFAGRNWELKSRKHIDRLESIAAEWRQNMEQRRIQQTAKVTSEIDVRIAELRTRAAEQQSNLNSGLQQQTEQLARERSASEAQIESRRRQETGRAEALAAEKQLAAQAVCAEQFERDTAGQRAESVRLVAAWNLAQEELRNVAQPSTALAAATLRWPGGDDSDWKLPSAVPTCVSVGDILVTVPKAPADPPSRAATNVCLEMPAVLRFPGDTSILVDHDSAGRAAALSFVRTQLLKLLTVIPAGRIRLTLIDPVGLGQSFSAMMHLADFDELLIHSRIWTDSSQIRDQLQKVTEHMENIFQTYLRSQFDTIEEYNASAGEVAEPYHFVVVAGFPTAFTDDSARHLSSILTSGPRCGVHAIVARNPSVGVPPSFAVDDLTSSCVRFHVVDGVVQPLQPFSPAVQFEQFPEPAADQYVKLVRDVGEQSKDARRVEVSFTRIAPRDDEIWSNSTADGIDLPIGRAGAARLQYMRLGRGTSQHALVAGKTGSGKSTLLHILITNLALHYGPQEIQFYLIDFKKGVEFRTYAVNRLPHARVVAIESDREFGLSVLERLDEILQERGELFRERGVQDVPSFREMFPAEQMPRLLLLVDEFQEFFIAEDRVSARASLLLDRLVRQGRAFGIHVLLGSQTLGGAYSLARSTMGQIAVRIALQCSESDAHLILSEDNMAARMLTRPGEAIYNDANGLLQGNHQFQIAWLDEARREEAIRTMLSKQNQPAQRDFSMVVFEGNVPPTAELCGPMNAWLTSPLDATRKAADDTMVWLGEPVAIAAPTCMELRRASGQNLLVVGQDESQVDSILAYTVLSTCCRSRPQTESGGAAELTMLHDGRDPESWQRFLSLKQKLQADSFVLKPAAECDAVIEQMYGSILAREENSETAAAADRFLVIRNIGQFRRLRRDDDDFGLGGFGEAKPPTTASMLSEILKRGPLVGIHVVVWSDTFSNAIRWLSGTLLREFEYRIAFRMNQTDSASLVDSPIAQSLGPGRAIIYRDQTGTTEKFRPFAWPSTAWLSSIRTTGSPEELNDLDIDSLTIE